MFEGLVGSIIWILANVLYIDLRRKGRSGFSRIILFWMGIPLTWLWLFLVQDGSAPEIQAPPDDAEALLAEIRRERRLSPGPPDGGREGPSDSLTSEDSMGKRGSGPTPGGDGPEPKWPSGGG